MVGDTQLYIERASVYPSKTIDRHRAATYIFKLRRVLPLLRDFVSTMIQTMLPMMRPAAAPMPANMIAFFFASAAALAATSHGGTVTVTVGNVLVVVL